MLIALAYRLGRRVLGVLGTVARGDGALTAEVLALRHENAVLRRQVARVRYESTDRAWFATLSALIPRARWGEVFPVTPATLLSWHRSLVAGKYAVARRKPGRPSTKPAVRALIIRMARDSPSWGRERIQGELANWKQFLHAQARTVIAADFLHVDAALLRRIYVLVFIERGTRRLHLAGVTAHPDGAWTAQQARNLAMAMGERLDQMRFLIRGRGGNFTHAFDAVFEDCGLRILKSPPQAPRANAICERMIGTLRREALDKILVLNEAHLRTVLAEYITHYNTARPHQGIARRVPDDDPDHPSAKVIDLQSARIRRRAILGGITSEYEVAA